MKKVLCFLLATIMMMLAVGCSAKQDDKNSKPSKKESVSSKEKTEIEEIVNEDGKAFVPDLSKSGVISKKIPLSSKQVELCGKTYTMPIKAADLMEDGWEIPGDPAKEPEFEANRVTGIAGFLYLINKDGAKINVIRVYNGTSSAQKLEGCQIVKFSLEELDKSSSIIDFVLPGGIVKKSTAKDIVSIYGNPNSEKSIWNSSSNSAKQLSYKEHATSEMSFDFYFNEDGTLNRAEVEIKKVVYKS